MMSAELLGVPAVAGMVGFELSGNEFPLKLCPELRMLQEISGVRIISLDSQGSGDLSLAVALALLRSVTTAYPPALVLESGKIDPFGDVGICAEYLPGSPAYSTNVGIIVSSGALHESRYLTNKAWIDLLPSVFAAQQFRFKLEITFWATAFYGGSPHLGLIGAISQLLREYLQVARALK